MLQARALVQVDSGCNQTSYRVYMQMMGLTNHSSPNGLVFALRIILGIAVAVAGVSLGFMFESSAAEYSALPIVIGSAIGGLGAGYILKKHFFFVLLIAVVVFCVYFRLTHELTGSDPVWSLAFYALTISIFIPVYIGAFVGFFVDYAISGSASRRQARTQ